MKRTLKTTLAYFLFTFSSIFGIMYAVFNLSTLFRTFTLIMVAISVIAVLKLSHCPYCCKYGIPVKPFLKQNPCCKKCGKQIR